MSRVQQIEDRLTTVNDVNAVKQRYAINFRGSVHDRAIALRDVVLARTADEVAAEIELIDSLAADYAASAGPMAEVFADPSLVDDAEVAAMAQIQQVESQTQPLVEEVVALRLAGDDAAALQVLTGEAKPQFVAWLDSTNVLIDLEEEMNTQETAQARDIASGFLVVMIALVLAAGALATAVAWWIVRSITRPLHQAVDVLAAVADGDLTARMDVISDDEVGRMGRSLNAALGAIGGAMTQVATRSDDLTQVSDRIAGLSGDIAGGASSSAAQAGVVADAAAEVSRHVQAVASGAEQMGGSISEISHSASESATVAERAVGTTTATMNRLGESSRAISEVVNVITSIAEQTNLLALNATIEAARAGEAGKGFSVVAGEVKDLAQETAKATDDISRKVETILADTREAASAISAVEGVMHQLHGHQMSIAAAVEEQTLTTTEMNRSLAVTATGSSQIAESIVDVARVSQSTTLAVEESQRAADDLSALAAELQQLMGQFRYAAS